LNHVAPVRCWSECRTGRKILVLGAILPGNSSIAMIHQSGKLSASTSRGIGRDESQGLRGALRIDVAPASTDPIVTTSTTTTAATRR
jgi:hypothetical protein